MTPVIACVNAPIVTGNQDITTVDLDGLTPKGALFIYSRATADGLVTSDSGSSFGAADASGGQWAFASVCEDNGAPTGSLAHTCAKSDKCVLALDGSAVHSDAAIVSFIADGVRINWTTAAADGWLLTVVFFAGDDWECKIGNWLTGTPPTNVALGWEPTCVLVGSAFRLFGSAPSIASGLHCLGANGWDPSGSRGGLFGASWANTSSQQRIIWAQGLQHGLASAGVKFTSFGYANTATRTSTTMSIAEAGVFGADNWGYMALKWSGRYARFGRLNIAAATGDQAFTGIGLIPKFVLLIPTQTTSSTGAWLGNCSMGLVAINADKAAGLAAQAKMNANPSQENSIALEDSIRLMASAGDGTIDTVCTVASFQPDGITLNFTTAGFTLSPGQSHHWHYMALGPITEDEDEEPTTGGATFAAIID